MILSVPQFLYFINSGSLSIFPGEKAEEDVQAISDRAGLIRREMGNKLRNQLRHIPEFVFFLDDSLDYIDRIENLLKDE